MSADRHAFDGPALGTHATAFLTSRFVRFLCVGGLNTMFGYAAFLIALRMGAGPTLALVSATALGILFNFQTSGRLVFRDSLHGRLPAFMAVQLSVLALNALALHLLVRLGVVPWLAQAVLILPVSATGYIAQRTLVFGSRPFGSLPIERVRASNHLVVLAGSAVLLVPNALFALQLRWPQAVLLLGGVLAAGALVAVRPAGSSESCLARTIDGRRLAISALVALALLVLGGEAHLLFANWDWLWRDAVLSDLARSPFPPSYVVDGRELVLRAPLGMYMLPAGVAKLAGLKLGHVALLAQNAALLTCVLYLLALLAGRRALLVVAIFLGFGGLDILGQALRSIFFGTPAVAFYPSMHIEHWTLFQYSSTVTQLFWVPNHALPSYWVALVSLLCAMGELMIVDLGLALAMVLFWSPFAVIGGLPLAAAVSLRAARPSLGSGRAWLSIAAALGFLVVALYMRADAAQVPHGFVRLSPLMLAAILVFLVLKIPHAFVVRAMWGDLDGRIKGLVVASIAMLVCLPTVRLGVSNDLVMRASIPALFILAFAFAHALDAAWVRRRPLCYGGMAIVTIASVTPAMEIVRALVTPRFAISDCGFLTVWKTLSPESDVSNYLARSDAMPDWVARPAPLAADGPRVCWPGLAPIDALDPDAKLKAIIQRTR